MTASIISRVIDAAAAGAGAGAGCLESRVWRVTTSGAGCVGAAAGSSRVRGWGTLNTDHTAATGGTQHLQGTL